MNVGVLVSEGWNIWRITSLETSQLVFIFRATKRSAWHRSVETRNVHKDIMGRQQTICSMWRRWAFYINVAVRETPCGDVY